MTSTVNRHVVTFSILTATVALAACVKSADTSSNGAASTTTSSAATPASSPSAAAAAFNAHSNVAGFHAKAITTLPSPAKAQKFEEGHFCADVAIKPTTAAGRDAAAKGWLVTTETAAAGYTSVGIFSQGESGTSGACYISDGNIVIYRDTQPVALVYGDPPKPDAGNKIGGAEATHTAGRLRIIDRSPADFPSADIVLKPDGIDVVPIAESEIACGLTIPKLYGLSPSQARALLGKTGWKPEPGESRATEGAIGEMVQENPELSDCAGTGFGFCTGGYKHSNGAVMQFTTVGDDNSIVSYDVQCPKK